MRAADAAMTIGSSAFAIGGKTAPATVDLAHAIRNILFRHGLAALLAICLLPASIHEVWGQLCVCAEPGWMNCALMGFSSHEPATAAFPQCMARSRGGEVGGRSGGESGGVGGGQRAFHRPKSRAPAAHVEHAPAYPMQKPQLPVAVPSQPAAVAPAPPSVSPPAASLPKGRRAVTNPIRRLRFSRFPAPKVS